MQLTRLFVLVLAFAPVIACDDDDPVGVDDVATIRIVNAASGTADVQVTRAGLTTPLAANLDFRNFTEQCVNVPAGSAQTLTFRSGTTVLATREFTFEENEDYTVFLTTNGTTRIATIVADHPNVTAGNNALRFINASVAVGDVYVFAPGGAMGTVAVEDLAVVSATSAAPQYILRPTAQTEVRFFDANATTNPRGSLPLSNLPASRTATVVFTEAGTPAGATAWMVTPC